MSDSDQRNWVESCGCFIVGAVLLVIGLVVYSIMFALTCVLAPGVVVTSVLNLIFHMGTGASWFWSIVGAIVFVAFLAGKAGEHGEEAPKKIGQWYTATVVGLLFFTGMMSLLWPSNFIVNTARVMWGQSPSVQQSDTSTDTQNPVAKTDPDFAYKHGCSAVIGADLQSNVSIGEPVVLMGNPVDSQGNALTNGGTVTDGFILQATYIKWAGVVPASSDHAQNNCVRVWGVYKGMDSGWPVVEAKIVEHAEEIESTKPAAYD